MPGEEREWSKGWPKQMGVPNHRAKRTDHFSVVPLSEAEAHLADAERELERKEIQRKLAVANANDHRRAAEKAEAEAAEAWSQLEFALDDLPELYIPGIQQARHRIIAALSNPPPADDYCLDCGEEICICSKLQPRTRFHATSKEGTD